MATHGLLETADKTFVCLHVFSRPDSLATKQIADLFDTLLEEKLPGTLQKALAEEEKAGGRAKRKAVALENSESGPNCRVRLGEEGHNEEKEKPKVFQFNFLFD